MDSLDLIRTFLAVVEAGSFTAAGQQLGKSKALVSKHIAELERRLGAILLNRTTRRVAVTEIGKAYCERVQETLAELDALTEAVRTGGGNPRGLLRLTAPQFFGELELVEMTSAFRRVHPQVEFDVLLTDRHVDLIREGFEIGFRIAKQIDSSLISRRLCELPFVICASPAYLDAYGWPASIEELANHACILDTNLPGGENWRFVHNGQRIEIKISPLLSVNSAAAVRQALIAGLGIGICPEFVVARAIARGELVELFEDKPDYPFGVHLVYPYRMHLSAKVRAFIDFAMEWYQPVPPWLRTTTSSSTSAHQGEKPASFSSSASSAKKAPPLQMPSPPSAPGPGSASSTRS